MNGHVVGPVLRYDDTYTGNFEAIGRQLLVDGQSTKPVDFTDDSVTLDVPVRRFRADGV